MDVEARYLDIEWQSIGVARRVNISTYPIKIEELPDGNMYGEVSIFHTPAPWIGLKLSGKLADTRPYTINAQDKHIEWLSIHDEHENTWWVPATSWCNSSNRHLSEMHRSFGSFFIKIGSHISLTLETMALELNRAHLQDYLDDFRDELVWLAIGRPTGALGEISSGYNHALIDALREFATVAGRILEHPAVEISEVTAPTTTYKLRPNSETFRALMRRPGAHSYPGRTAQESADIADNRYLCGMVMYCLRLAQTLIRSSKRHQNHLEARKEREEKRANDLRSTESIAIDKEVFENQINSIKEVIEAISSYTETASTSARTYKFLLTGIYKEGSKKYESFFYRNANRDVQYDKKHNIKFSIVQFPPQIHKKIKDAYAVGRNLALTVLGDANVTTFPTSPDTAKGRCAKFTRISSIEVNSPHIKQRDTKYAQYDRTNWHRPINSSEREEYRCEADTAQKRADEFRKHAQTNTIFSSNLDVIVGILNRQCAGWKHLGVTSSSIFPMSIRFTHNPFYAAALAAFRKIKRLNENTGLSENTLDRLESINVLHASALYEKWCLIKIVAILLQDFDFVPQHNWMEHLVTLVTRRENSNHTSLSLTFTRTHPNMSAYFDIEPVLTNKRRPDFRLRFYIEPSTSSSQKDNCSLSDEDKALIIQDTGLIMDAKFRTKWGKDKLSKMVDELVNTKDYGQDGDRVFILQPVKSAIASKISPLIWGADCDYGQVHSINHRHGSIQIAAGPVPSESSMINLKRLIALQFQQVFPKPTFITKEELEICCTNDSFCINCGKTHETSNVEQKRTKSGNLKWHYSCPNCYTQTIRTHCYNCNTSLYKNGFQMTYHLTVADQISNIVCPKCGSGF